MVKIPAFTYSLVPHYVLCYIHEIDQNVKNKKRRARLKCACIIPECPCYLNPM